MSSHKQPRPRLTPLEERIDPATLKVVPPIEDQRQLQQGAFRATLGVQNERETVTLAQPQNGRTLQVSSSANKEGFVIGKDGLNSGAKKQEPGSLDGQQIGINPQVIDARPGANKSLMATTSNIQSGSSVDQGPIKMRNPGTMSLSEVAKSNNSMQSGSMLSNARVTSDMSFAPPANHVAWATASQNQSTSFVIGDDPNSASSSLEPSDSTPKPESSDIRELDDLNRTVYSTGPRPQESVNILVEPQKSDDESETVYVFGPLAIDQTDVTNGLPLRKEIDAKERRKDEDDTVTTSTSVSPTPNEMRETPVTLFVLTSAATQRNLATVEQTPRSTENSVKTVRLETDRSLPESHVVLGSKSNESPPPNPAVFAGNSASAMNNTLMADVTPVNAGQSDLITNQQTQRRASPPAID